MTDDEIIRAAMRVRFCLALRPPEHPNPSDLESLRQAVSGEDQELPANVLADRILRREMERRKKRRRKVR
jgi:hypothetical protein